MGGDLSARASVGREVSWITGAWSLGFLLGPALGGVGDLALPYVTYASICLVALVLSLFSLHETQTRAIDLSWSRFRRIISLPEVQCSSLATLSLAFYYGSFDAFVPWLLSSRGISRPGIALLFSVLALPSVILPRVIGQAADRMGDRSILNFGQPTNGLLALLFLDVLATFPLWLGFLALGITEVAIYIPAIAMLQRAVDNRGRGTAMAIHILAFSIGFVLGPVVSGHAIEHTSYQGVFLIMGLTMLVSLVAGNTLLALRRAPRGPVAQEEARGDAVEPLADEAATLGCSER
jgi:MFS family permease